MKRKTWLIIAIAVVCLAVLGVTIWCVVGGVKSTLPQTESDPQTETEQVPTAPQEEIVPIDPETGAEIVTDPVQQAPVSEKEQDVSKQEEQKAETKKETEVPDVEDNMVEDPWGELETEDSVGSTPIEEELTEEEKTEKELTEEELATSDEGWTGIY